MATIDHYDFHSTSRRSCVWAFLCMTFFLFATSAVEGQELAETAGPPPDPRKAAPIDLTGYWVSLVSEDWRWRMLTPPKGDYISVPLNEAGRAEADLWTPDEPASCKPFGAAAIMRVPTRLRVSWVGDSTLRIETDHGMQVRGLAFGSSATFEGRPASRQGDSVAEWDGTSLKVVTRNMKAGYLRWNGVPFSDQTTLTEYFELHTGFEDDWMTVTSIVSDPTYLTTDFVTSSSFKREASDAKWNPVPCQEPAS